METLHVFLGQVCQEFGLQFSIQKKRSLVSFHYFNFDLKFFFSNNHLVCLPDCSPHHYKFCIHLYMPVENNSCFHSIYHGILSLFISYIRVFIHLLCHFDSLSYLYQVCLKLLMMSDGNLNLMGILIFFDSKLIAIYDDVVEVKQICFYLF